MLHEQALKKGGNDELFATRMREAVDQQAFNAALIELISRRNLPIQLVEWPEFYTLLNACNPQAPALVVRSRSAVTPLLKSVFDSYRQRVVDRLHRSHTLIHFAVDAWSSPGHRSLLAVVAHFTTPGHLGTERALLGLREIAGHTGVEMADKVEEVIDDYELRDNVGFFTLDNATSNDVLVDTLAIRLRFANTLDVPRRVRCHGHILNLAVQAFLFGKDEEANTEAESQVEQLSLLESTGTIAPDENHASRWRGLGVLGRIHNIVMFIHSSDKRHRIFEEKAGRSIPRDNTTRWNSWYKMISVAITLRSDIVAFTDRYAREDPALEPDILTQSDWKELEDIRDFLKPFEEITLDMQGHSATLDGIISSMDFLITHFDYYKTKYAVRNNRAMAARVLAGWYKFDRYYKATDDNPIYVAAILLHPNRRVSYLKAAWESQSQYIEPAIQGVRDLWRLYGAHTMRVDCDDEVLSPYQRWQRDGPNALRVACDSRDDFERFIIAEPIKITCSAFAWWQEPTQQQTYPDLAKLALNVFSIPAMSDEPERVFSGARHTVAYSRTRLKAKTIEQLECIKHWVTRGLVASEAHAPQIDAMLVVSENDAMGE